MTRLRAILAAAILLLAGAGPPAGPPIDIDGNIVLVDEVYQAALDLPAGMPATPATARAVEAQVIAFLRRAGYALATARARAAGGRIRVQVDEGKLAKIVVRGRDAVSTLAVQLQFDLPYDVFNRPQLERLLQRFRGGGARVSYALVPVRRVSHSGPQLDPLALLPGGAPLSAAGAYELHIAFEGGGRRSGFNLVAGIDPDSIRTGGGYAVSPVFLAGDRLEVQAQAGANYFVDLRRQADELHFSRAFVDVRWLAPGFLRDTLRPTVRLREDILRRQRQDLLVETYWWNRLEGAIGLGVEPADEVKLGVEIGLQRRDLFHVIQLDDDGQAPPVEPASEVRAFVGLDGRIVLDPDRLRIDRRHRLQFEARQLVDRDRRSIWLADADYRRVFEFGWNDLWLRAAAGGVAGSYTVADAIPMSGRYLRGVFGHALYLDRAASLGLEFRFSLTRDIFKLGFYHEAAIVREARGIDPRGEVRFGNSFGPSFHTLVLDTLQLDIYYAAGFLLDGPFDHGVSLRVEKAF
jgi:hypothetical protein